MILHELVLYNHACIRMYVCSTINIALLVCVHVCIIYVCMQCMHVCVSACAFMYMHYCWSFQNMVEGSVDELVMYLICWNTLVLLVLDILPMRLSSKSDLAEITPLSRASWSTSSLERLRAVGDCLYFFLRVCIRFTLWRTEGMNHLGNWWECNLVVGICAGAWLWLSQIL